MLQEHLIWARVHVVGHSMGGMVATRLAALAPERVASLTLISTTAGGAQAIPRSWRAVKYALEVRLSSHPAQGSGSGKRNDVWLSDVAGVLTAPCGWYHALSYLSLSGDCLFIG